MVPSNTINTNSGLGGKSGSVPKFKIGDMVDCYFDNGDLQRYLLVNNVIDNGNGWSYYLSDSRIKFNFIAREDQLQLNTAQKTSGGAVYLNNLYMSWRVGDEVEQWGITRKIVEYDPVLGLYKLDDNTWSDGTKFKKLNSPPIANSRQPEPSYHGEPRCTCGAWATGFFNVHSDWCDKYQKGE